MVQVANTRGPGAALADLDQLLASLRPDQRLHAWRVEFPGSVGRATGAWLIGDRLFVATPYAAVLQFNARTGRRLPDLGLPSRKLAERISWVSPVDATGHQAIVLAGASVQLAELDTGRSLKAVAGDFDGRIAPVPLPDGFIAVPGYRGQKLVRMSWEGKQLWEAALPGYAMCHPAAGQGVLIVQTRQGSYGGQATTAVEIDTGRRLWSERTDAYGHGIVLGEDTLIEANQWLSPSDTRGWLICREARTGKVLWRHELPGGISHRPVVDRDQRRVFALFEPARLMCFNERNGQVLWAVDLPAPPANGAADSYYPQRHVMQLQGEGTDRSLVIMDGRHVAHFFDPGTGKLKASSAMASVMSGAPSGYENGPIAAPWLLNDLLVVAGLKHAAAHPASILADARQPMELPARALRAKLLLQLGQAEAAREQLQQLQAICPDAPGVLEAQAELFGPTSPFKDVQAEGVARLRLLRVTAGQTDSRLAEQFGLVRRVDVGPILTRPLLAGKAVYVASRAGSVHAFDADTLKVLGRHDVGVPVVSALTFLDNAGGLLVFATENRHTVGLSITLQPRFDLPSRSNTEYYVLGDVLVRSWPSIPSTRLALLDPKTGEFGPEVEIQRSPMEGYVHDGRLYFLRPGGGTVSFDGRGMTDHPALLQLDAFGAQQLQQAALAVNTSGAQPVAFGAGGVYQVDGHLRASRKLLPSDTRIHAAAASKEALVVLRGQAAGQPWMWEAWTAYGTRQLPLRCPALPYHARPGYAPQAMPLGRGFLLIGRELMYVEPDKESPLWRFCPDNAPDTNLACFRLPVVHGQTLLATHDEGDLLVFDLKKILPP